MPLRLCVKAEILIAQLSGCSVGPVFRRQMPMIRVLLKKNLSAKSHSSCKVFQAGCAKSLSNFANLGLYIFL